MRIPGKKAVRKSIGWIESRFNKHALILGYHRVADAPDDPYRICVSSEHFVEQMAVLQKLTRLIRIEELVAGIQKGTLPERSIAITFDDGYADLLQTVKPILEEYQIPCTVFIVTGSLGQEYWWDELERLMPTSTDKAENLQKTDYQKLLPLSLAERQRAINRLRDRQAHGPVKQIMSRALTLDELVELSNCYLIEIGAHGVNHLSLSQLPGDEQRSELLDSKMFLEKNLGKVIHGISYPNGSYSTLTEKLALECGYTYACQSRPGAVFLHSNLYQLPRFWVPDWDGEVFRRWLVKWL